jgi:hypothetical protein
VKYELGFYIPEDGILHSHRRENLESYMEDNSAMKAVLDEHDDDMILQTKLSGLKSVVQRQKLLSLIVA